MGRDVACRPLGEAMNRRSFLLGAAGILAAPAIVRASSIMPVKTLAYGDGVARARIDAEEVQEEMFA